MVHFLNYSNAILIIHKLLFILIFETKTRRNYIFMCKQITIDCMEKEETRAKMRQQSMLLK